MAKKQVSIRNKSATYEYFIDATYTAGIMLLGTEVKSVKDSRVSFNDSYCIIHDVKYLSKVYTYLHIVMVRLIIMIPLETENFYCKNGKLKKYKPSLKKKVIRLFH